MHNIHSQSSNNLNFQQSWQWLRFWLLEQFIRYKKMMKKNPLAKVPINRRLKISETTHLTFEITSHKKNGNKTI